MWFDQSHYSSRDELLVAWGPSMGCFPLLPPLPPFGQPTCLILPLQLGPHPVPHTAAGQGSGQGWRFGPGERATRLCGAWGCSRMGLDCACAIAHRRFVPSQRLPAGCQNNHSVSHALHLHSSRTPPLPQTVFVDGELAGRLDRSEPATNLTLPARHTRGLWGCLPGYGWQWRCIHCCDVQ